MSLDKAIASGQEHRRPYSGSKAIDPSCRCHGGCDWCLGNRMYRTNRLKEAADQAEAEYEEDLDDDCD